MFEMAVSTSGLKNKNRSLNRNNFLKYIQAASRH